MSYLQISLFKYAIKKAFFFIAFSAISVAGFSQSAANNDSTLRIDKQYLKSYWTDFKGVVISPLHWSKGEAFAAGGVLASAAILYSQDKQIAEFFQRNRTQNLDNLDKYFFDPFGKMYYTASFMGSFYLYGVMSKKNKPKAVAMDFVKASLYSAIIVSVIKNVAHRSRPFQTISLNPYIWDGPNSSNWSHNSFPSGHTIMSWTFASVLATHYQNKLWIPITVYSLATMEGVARMYINKHWSSDVMIASALGYAIGTYVVKHQKYNLNIRPVIGNNYSGIGIDFCFGKPKSN